MMQHEWARKRPTIDERTVDFWECFLHILRSLFWVMSYVLRILCVDVALSVRPKVAKFSFSSFI